MKFLFLLFGFSSTLSAQAIEVVLANPGSDKVSFGYVNYNLSRSQKIEIENTTALPVVIESVESVGFGFSTRHQCIKTLQPSEKCEVNVAFWNVNPGPALGSLNIKTSSAERNVQLTAVGGADPFDLSVIR